MRIGIIGAGAIGGLVGVSLARRGHAVGVLARGQTLSVLRAQGWILERNGERLRAEVIASDDAEELGMQDLLVIAVKGPALAQAAHAAGPMIGPDTIVVPAMNGVPWWFLLSARGSVPPTMLHSVDPDGAIGRAIRFDAVLGSAVHVSAYVAAPAVTIHQSGNKLIFGEPNGTPSERLGMVADLFANAGFETLESANIQRDIWYKLWGNMTMNPISALCAATCDRIIDDELVRALVLRVMAEAAAIGKRIDCRIDESGEDRIAITRKMGAFKTSMLQDAEAGRLLEIDQLLAAPREIARLAGVATPNLDALLGLARLYARNRNLYPRRTDFGN
ncbi:MAG TPA: 2-dehydropantoate 2-reductase [Rhizomicrobium sp.]|jgi:2-dehydropantoate 2-reductase|nr:2-dehydropantoate 2-reductase [Rhizomicrobium sp.]